MADQKVPLLSPPSYDETTASAPKPLPRPQLSLPVIKDLNTKRVVLASASPRRRQILGYLGLQNFEIIPSTVPENFPKTLTPFEYVLETATQKATTIYKQEINNEERGEPALILAADTIVADVSTGDILEKPRSEADHIRMLKRLRDVRDHKVYTAIVAMVPLESAREPGYAIESAVEETSVRFDAQITDDLILAYVKSREGVDKAGGYGMQGLGSILVEKIDGSYDNVIGLPLRTTLMLIEKAMRRADDDDVMPGEESEEEE